ncbi:hypothetical protein, partial [Paenibacillus odorifer]
DKDVESIMAYTEGKGTE